MSEFNKEISEVDVGTVGNADIGDDQGFGDSGGVYKNDDQKKRQQKEGVRFGYGYLCAENFRKAEKVVLVPITKAKKQIFHRRNKRVSLSSSSSPVSASAANANGSLTGNTVKGCCFCFRQPHTLDSSDEYNCSDPNDPYFEMLKSLIETNDFYSKECNPHLDFHDHNDTR